MPYVTTAERIGVKKGIEIGETRGIEIGKAGAMRNALLTLLTARFGELPVSVSQAITSASIDTLESWFTVAVTADSLKSVGIEERNGER